jgi:hypothetical protein
MEEKQKYQSCQHAKRESPSANVEVEKREIREAETREKKSRRAEVEMPQKKKQSRNGKAAKQKNDRVFMFEGKE